MEKNKLVQTTLNNLKLFSGTFVSILDSFLIERITKGLSKHTIEFYRNELLPFSNWLEGNGFINFQDVSTEIIRSYLLSIRGRRSPGGVHATYRAIRALFNWYEFEYEPEGWKNPIKKVKVSYPRGDPLPGVAIEDIERMAEVCKNIRDKAIICCLLDTGCRAAEFVKLDLNHVDLITGSIWVEKGKGGRSRYVFIERKSKRYLKQYLNTRTDNNPAVWVTDEGDRLTYDGLFQIIKRRARDAGIPAPGLHDFRRAFGKLCKKKGLDILTISRLLGHSSLEVTKRYIVLDDSDLREAHRQAGPVDNSNL